MTVYRIDAWRAKPGRRNDLVKLYHDAAALFRGAGSGQTFLTSAGPGGEQALMIQAVSAWDSFEHYGQHFTDGLTQNPQWQALADFALGPDSPGQYLGAWLVNEVSSAGERLDPQPGMVHIVRGWKARPGRADEFVGGSELIGPHVQHHGGGIRVLANAFGGESQSTHFTVAAFPNMQAAGRYLDEMHSNDEIRRIVRELTGPDSPATHVFSRVDTVIA